MPGNYQVLADIYDEINMGQFGHNTIGRIVNFAQQNDWMGRTFIDLGCGTGASIEFFNQYQYIVTGVDQSPEMLAIARNKYPNVRFDEQDIRQLENIPSADMAICLNVINELDSLNDLKATFESAYKVLRDNKLLIFDMYTIEGLIERYRTGDHVAYRDSDDRVMVFTTNDFDYERQIHMRNYTIFKKAENDLWKRTQANRILRAYPVQAIMALLQRCGFKLSSILTSDFERYTPNDSGVSRVLFIAEKQ